MLHVYICISIHSDLFSTALRRWSLFVTWSHGKGDVHSARTTFEKWRTFFFFFLGGGGNSGGHDHV